MREKPNEWREAFYHWRGLAFHPENYPKETLLDEAEKYFTKSQEAFEIAQKTKELMILCGERGYIND